AGGVNDGASVTEGGREPKPDATRAAGHNDRLAREKGGGPVLPAHESSHSSFPPSWEKGEPRALPDELLDVICPKPYFDVVLPAHVDLGEDVLVAVLLVVLVEIDHA